MPIKFGISVAPIRLGRNDDGNECKKFTANAFSFNEGQLAVSWILACLPRGNLRSKLRRNLKRYQGVSLLLQSLQHLRPTAQEDNVVEGIAKLATKEREVRTLEMLIECISSLDDEDLARMWPRLMAAIYSSQLPALGAK